MGAFCMMKNFMHLSFATEALSMMLMHQLIAGVNDEQLPNFVTMVKQCVNLKVISCNNNNKH